MPKLTEEQRLNLIKDYKTGNFSCPKLSKIYKINTRNVLSLLRRRKVKVNNNISEICRKYPLNQNYFDKIDTKEKAYWLGLLYADGCNIENKNIIKLCLQEKDKYILDLFKKCLNTTKPLGKERKKYKNEYTGNILYTLVINSKQISKQLKNFGVVARKSNILKFPNFIKENEDFLKSFLLGFFDGDGCICMIKEKNYKRFIFSITSTHNFCESIRQIIYKKLKINTQIHKYKNRAFFTSSLYCRGNKKIYKLLSWLYKDEKIYFERKYEKFLELKNKQQSLYGE